MMAEREAVRLVIWDLDETFWRGTLSEGGIEYIAENHDLVVELSRRGIMSSICSNNDYETIETILREKGIWDYFIFPSIDWSPKPRRIKEIIEAVQLRAPTVLFIDDNPSQRAAAAEFIEGLQVEDEHFIAAMRQSPLFKGKEDAGLTRLAQYKLIEKRHSDQLGSGRADEDFLRASGVTVTIDTDITGNIERAVELINRTNQLNFTKHRLPDDPVSAAETLTTQLKPYYAQSGLVRVHDKYGDYGYCGFYLVNARRLVHFCFSCRILGFGVEHWLYERLKRPSLEIVGEVLSDPRARRVTDWINAGAAAGPRARHDQDGLGFRGIRLRGACEMSILEHYFLFDTEHVKHEGNHGQNRLTLRGDSLWNLANGTGRQTETIAAELMKLGFHKQGLVSQFFASPAAKDEALILFCDADLWMKTYRHKKLGFFANFQLDDYQGDLCSATKAAISAHIRRFDDTETVRQDILSKHRLIRKSYECVAEDSPEFVRAAELALGHVLMRLPAGSTLFLITPHIFHRLADGLTENRSALRFIAAVASAAADFRNVVVLNLGDFIASDDEILDHRHYSRIVYYRLYRHIRESLTQARVVETIRFGTPTGGQTGIVGAPARAG